MGATGSWLRRQLTQRSLSSWGDRCQASCLYPKGTSASLESDYMAKTTRVGSRDMMSPSAGALGVSLGPLCGPSSRRRSWCCWRRCCARMALVGRRQQVSQHRRRAHLPHLPRRSFGPRPSRSPHSTTCRLSRVRLQVSVWRWIVAATPFTWNGASWSPSKLIAWAGAALGSVSCTSASFRAAVGSKDLGGSPQQLSDSEVI